MYITRIVTVAFVTVIWLFNNAVVLSLSKVELGTRVKERDVQTELL